MEMCVTSGLAVQVTRMSVQKLSRCLMGEIVTFMHPNLYLGHDFIPQRIFSTNFVEIVNCVYFESQNIHMSSKSKLNIIVYMKKSMRDDSHHRDTFIFISIFCLTCSEFPFCHSVLALLFNKHF